MTAAQGSFLLKQDSHGRILKKILIEIIRCDKNSRILIRSHPKESKSNLLRIINELKIKKNVFITKLHPQILARISSRIIFNSRSNVMTDIFRAKMIDCSEYKNIDLIKNNGKDPANYGYGVIYINPQKSSFSSRFREVLMNDYFFSKKEIYQQEKILIQNNKFDYKRVEMFFKTL